LDKAWWKSRPLGFCILFLAALLGFGLLRSVQAAALNTGSGQLEAAGSDEQPPAGLPAGGPARGVTFPTPVSGETQVFFETADSDASATVLTLYNTDSVDHTVELKGFSTFGLTGTWFIPVPSGAQVHVGSDSTVASPPPSWSSTNFFLANFTDFTNIASLSLPKGVKVNGYTLFNPGTGTIDPRVDQGAIPLRFSTDPSSVFLPAADRAN
jgi:hypothetical protein